MATPNIEGPAEFVQATEAALELLRTGDPARAQLVATHLAHVTGLGHRDIWRLGRTTLYGRDRQAITRPVAHAWVDRRHRQCFVAPSIWQIAPGDAAALRRYATVLVHEAAHLYLNTEDEAACNAEMKATQALLDETDGDRCAQAPGALPLSAR